MAARCARCTTSASVGGEARAACLRSAYDRCGVAAGEPGTAGTVRSADEGGAARPRPSLRNSARFASGGAVAAVARPRLQSAPARRARQQLFPIIGDFHARPHHARPRAMPAPPAPRNHPESQAPGSSAVLQAAAGRWGLGQLPQQQQLATATCIPGPQQADRLRNVNGSCIASSAPPAPPPLPPDCAARYSQGRRAAPRRPARFTASFRNWRSGAAGPVMLWIWSAPVPSPPSRATHHAPRALDATLGTPRGVTRDPTGTINQSVGVSSF